MCLCVLDACMKVLCCCFGGLFGFLSSRGEVHRFHPVPVFFLSTHFCHCLFFVSHLFYNFRNVCNAHNLHQMLQNPEYYPETLCLYAKNTIAMHINTDGDLFRTTSFKHQTKTGPDCVVSDIWKIFSVVPVLTIVS